jgi:hypothetical protein
MNISSRLLIGVVGLAVACASIACGSASARGDANVAGIYANPEGNASVEFMSGGKAHFSLHGVGGQCTYTQKDRQILLICEGERTEFTVEDDGALIGPPDSFMTRLKKKAQSAWHGACWCSARWML